MKILFLFVTVFFLCSCRQDPVRQHRELLLGEWYPIEDTALTVLHIRDYNMQGYRFMEGGLCEYYPGYFDYADPDNGHLLSYPYRNLKSRRIIYWLRNIIRPYGNRTNYEISDDTLKTFNLSSKTWDKQMISFLSPDTMLLSSLDSSIQDQYIRKKWTLEDKPLFDQLIFHHPKSFAEDHFFSIQRDGTFVYNEFYAGLSKFLTGKLKEGTFEYLEDLFNKANLPRVIAKRDSIYQHNDDYRHFSLSSFPPSFDSYVTFVSDNQFFTMENPFYEVSFDNKAFFWAYTYGLFLPELAQFESGTLERDWDYIPFFEGFIELKLQKQDSIVDLYHAEKFYLSVLLNQADTTHTDFEPVYTLKESYSSKKHMQTDGRYFSYIQNGEKITLDIGFNYIRKNSLDRMFRKKDSIEISFETGEDLVPVR